ncbi:hypothetical protein ELUMI_v1c07870 [Williamsoniiplasma luminosum]|uniref:Uncharacterized protein n=1 Tax=Williamsoniiplasma luminosum TaxID=214888 RepID=A0A2K8NUM6_9MOLU|nr:hypothetical protein [Williamsoniiplasma luminosum]ATZ17509.1 hypothetical protein ELUMI_v1c07870 [Williamsoniiplasma luminosum]
MKSNQNWSSVYMFCKQCWEQRKFDFPQDFNDLELTDQISGKCSVCERKQAVLIKDIKEYYDHLNDHNE